MKMSHHQTTVLLFVCLSRLRSDTQVTTQASKLRGPPARTSLELGVRIQPWSSSEHVQGGSLQGQHICLTCVLRPDTPLTLNAVVWKICSVLCLTGAARFTVPGLTDVAGFAITRATRTEPAQHRDHISNLPDR